MRTLRPLLMSAAILALSLAVSAQQAAGPEGHWEGAIQIPGQPLQVLVDLTKSADGSLAGVISIPLQGAKDLPLSEVKAEEASLSFAIAGIPGSPTFKGFLSADGAKVSGEFAQGGQSFPFELAKSDPTAEGKKALEGLDALLEQALRTFEVPGMAVAVTRGSEVIYLRGFGLRDTEKNLPVTPQTLFAIGSSTKAFTTFTLGTLVQEGKVDWDTPVREYLPGFRMYEDTLTERLTVRDLVTHRSGLPRHDLLWYNNQDISRADLVLRLRYLPPSADLREKFQYNNLMFMTAGYLTERLTGKTWEEAVTAQVLKPLGMSRTNFDVRVSEADPDAALPYEKRDEKVVKVPYRPIVNMGPAGSINSSAADMSRWLIVQADSGRLDGKQVLDGAIVEDLHKVHMPIEVEAYSPEIVRTGYAMGWFVETYRGHQRVQHGGNIDGFSAMVSLLPREGIGVVALANLGGTPLPELACRVIQDRLLKLEPKDWIGEAAARKAKGEAAEKEAKTKKYSVRRAGTKPAHALEEYAGEYAHPGYGSWKVALEQGRLVATYNGIATPLEHWHYEVFNGLKATDPVFEDAKLTFRTDVRGQVDALLVTMDPTVAETVFSKKPDAKFFEPAYLKRFVGSYELAGETIRVSLKGPALVVSAKGQPDYELVPRPGGEFVLKGVEVIAMRFVEQAGKVTALESIQPDGLYTAKRMEEAK